MPNVELLRRMKSLIEKNEDGFHMGDWASFGPNSFGDIALDEDDQISCGTTLCLAGWAAVAAGYVVKESVGGGVDAVEDDITVYFSEAWNGTHWHTLGADLMGIPKEQATSLFYSSSYRARRILDLLVAGESFDWDVELHDRDMMDPIYDEYLR